ncbi:hypothetical protein HaLaN_18851 [Haematococcus lacustris]|uniref:Uncharacterized protein n=1 Tax=Haematococcus lacustris TaxID=44745 RepID=A0A699ZFL8_HAELA|nr:hypothetical protein HaLaN_18851 [Haematococcus lacustris]
MQPSRLQQPSQASGGRPRVALRLQAAAGNVAAAWRGAVAGGGTQAEAEDARCVGSLALAVADGCSDMQFLRGFYLGCYRMEALLISRQIDRLIRMLPFGKRRVDGGHGEMEAISDWRPYRERQAGLRGQHLVTEDLKMLVNGCAPAQAAQYCIELAPGDQLILGTHGLFDMVWLHGPMSSNLRKRYLVYTFGQADYNH